MNLKRKLVTGIATSAILLNALTPMVFADTTLTISGNGSDSNNTVEVETSHEVTVQQSNDADVHNNVTSSAKTGGNEAEDNTGGNVKIKTGDANSTVNVDTTVNSNQADVQCDTCGGDVTATISGNGTDSDNTIDLDNNTENRDGSINIVQENDADVYNRVYSNAKTGYNEAEDNTGGNVKIKTGDATSDVSVSTMANANVAMVSGSNGGSSLTAQILGNGSDSDNTIELEARHSIMIWQENDADVHNNVTSSAKTGGNEAEDNTGGNVKIDTGDAEANATVNNMVNFNFVDADCGCEMSVVAKIAGNGEHSTNKIEVEDLSSFLGIYQGGEHLGNDADLWNNVYAGAKTGYNEAEDNTAELDPGDPSIETGDATSDVTVENTANKNVVGPSGDFGLPGGATVSFHFDLAAFLAFFNLS